MLASIDHDLVFLLIMATFAAVILAIVIFMLCKVPRLGIFFLLMVSGLSSCFLAGEPFGGFFILLSAVGLVRYWQLSRKNLTMHVFSTLGVAMRQNMPLASALQADASGQKGRYRKVMSDVSAFLSMGEPLSNALRIGYPICPGYALAMIAAAEKINQLPLVIERIEKKLSLITREDSKSRLSMQGGYTFLLVLIVLVLTFVMFIFIQPKFAAIFMDMGVELPLLPRIVHNVIHEHGEIIALILFLMIFLGLPMIGYVAFRTRRADRLDIWARLGDSITWLLPFAKWFEFNNALFQTVSFLRISLQAGATVDDAIEGAASLDVNLYYRRRLRKWLAMVQQGEDIADSARKCRVGSQIAWAFDQTVNPGRTIPVLESLESFYQAKYGYAATIARNIAVPFTTLIMATLVAVVVYTIFSPCVKMLEVVVDSVMPA